MAHPEIRNETPFAFAPVFLLDEEARTVLVPTIKATFTIAHGQVPLLAKKQPELMPLGEFYGEPETSSYRIEPEASLPKPSTNVVLIGHAYAPFAGARETTVGITVGTRSARVNVVGDRFWELGLGSISMTDPEPFEKIPLTWERAFGGWDRRFPDPELYSFEPRNPVGRGFVGRRSQMDQPHPLPNIESLKQPIQNYGDTPEPVGFGFTSPNWQPRASFSGTYDDEWQKHRMPRLPRDFDRRFLNSAPGWLVAEQFLKGGERVTVENATASGLHLEN